MERVWDVPNSQRRCSFHGRNSLHYLMTVFVYCLLSKTWKHSRICTTAALLEQDLKHYRVGFIVAANLRKQTGQTGKSSVMSS